MRRETAVVGFLVLSLAVSLGGAIVALTLNASILWRALPFHEPDRLLKIEPLDRQAAPRWLSLPELRMLADAPPAPLAAIAGYTSADYIALAEPGIPPQPLIATLVTSQFFNVFPVTPSLGALPGDAAHGPGSERVVLLGYQLWQRRYGGAPDIVGRSIRLTGPEYLPGSDGAYRVAGVLPPDLWLFWREIDIVLPLRADPRVAGDVNSGLIEHVVARLDRSGDVAAIRAQGPAFVERLKTAGALEPPVAVTIDSLQTAHYRRLTPQLRIVASVALLVLTLAVVNVVLAATAQALSRRRESAIRVAVGATEWRLWGDTVREHAITSLVAGALGLTIGMAWTKAAIRYVPSQWLSRVPGGAAALRPDSSVGWALVGVLLVVVLAASLAVQMIARHRRPWLLLQRDGVTGSGGTHRLRSGLVTAEIAFCGAALGIGGILLLQLLALQRVDMGVATERTSALWLNLNPSKYATASSRAEYYDAVLQRARAVPGIETIGGVDLPFQQSWQQADVRSSSDGAPVVALTRAATPEYPDAAGLTLVDGRWFTSRDGSGNAPVAVISRALAQTLWPGQTAIGRTIRVRAARATRPDEATVIGVISDTRHAVHRPADRIVYRPVRQRPPGWLYLVLETRAGAGDVMPALSAAIWQVDPDQPIDGPWPIAEWVDMQTAHLRFIALLTGIVAIVGAILCAAGLYALTAFWVQESARDLGVRRAVGAADAQIASWFARRLALVIVPGVAAGVLLQLGAIRLVISGIESVNPPDTLQMAAGVLAVIATALCGAAVPFHRALQADANTLLRG